jgi:hypothetical protein
MYSDCEFNDACMLKSPAIFFCLNHMFGHVTCMSLFYVLRRLRHSLLVTHYFRHSILVPQTKNVKKVYDREMIDSFASWNGESS